MQVCLVWRSYASSHKRVILTSCVCPRRWQRSSACSIEQHAQLSIIVEINLMAAHMEFESKALLSAGRHVKHGAHLAVELRVEVDIENDLLGHQTTTVVIVTLL